MSEEIPDSLLEEAAAALPTTEKLKELKEAVERLLEVRKGIETLADRLKVGMTIAEKLEHETLPLIMQECGLSEFATEGGIKIKIVPVYSASVTDERKPEAWQWLKDNDYGSLIKNKFSISFGMGEEEATQQLKVTLTEAHIPYEQKEDVHASTLKALVAELYEKGVEFPEKVFGAFHKKVAKIETSKPRKK